ncbi:MAG: hypothetical protein QM811_24250 [Pirellulales bacterium]
MRSALWLAIALSVWQLVLIGGLNWGLAGREIGSDVNEYRFYVREPWLLFQPTGSKPLYGGRVAAPALPLLIAAPYHVFSMLGCPAFVAFRMTLCGYVALGVWLTWRTIFQTAPPESKAEKWLAVGITFMPLTWIASAVLSQDDCVTLAWSALCFWLWRMSGPVACQRAALVGMFVAKPFYIVLAAALWIAYPKLRRRFGISTAVAVGVFAAFFFVRDGRFTPAAHDVDGFASATWCVVLWLWNGGIGAQDPDVFAGLVKPLSIQLTLWGMSLYGLALLWRKPSLTAAVVGLYTVFFTFHLGMMPEYEFWYFPWVVWTLWLCAERKRRLLFAAVGLHNVLGYVYKVLYVCDEYNIPRIDVKPLRALYTKYVDWDLRWPMLFVAAGTIAAGAVTVIELWRGRRAAGSRSVGRRRVLN